jgi:F420 biosynthesis protein FbiB-like protein
MISHNSFHDILNGRRSIRRYLAEPVSQETALRLLQAATSAPSAHNRQPWRFVALRDDGKKSHLAQAMGLRLRTDRLHDGDPADAIDRDVVRSYARITEAPLVVIACLSLVDMDQYPDARRSNAERLMAVQSVAMACQNLLLAAHAEGLGSSWMCAPLFCPDTVATALDLPTDWEPQALLTIGAPANQGKPSSRHPIASVVRMI